MAMDKVRRRDDEDLPEVQLPPDEVEVLAVDLVAQPIEIDGEELLEVVFPHPEGEDELALGMEIGFDANLAEYMDDSELGTLSSDLIGEVEADIASRKDWIKTYLDGLDLLGMKIETRSEPWAGACGVVHPMLSEAVVKFQSEVMMATFPASGPVRTEIIGKETTAKKESAARVEHDMNYLLTKEMVEYRSEHERMLWGLGLSGNAFKKTYYDPNWGRPASMYVPAEDLVVPYGATNLMSAERVTHVMRKTENELRKLQYSGFYRDIELDEPQDTLDDIEKKIAQSQGFEATLDSRYRVYEIHTELDLPGFEHTDEYGQATGIALPYVVTIERDSGEVLSIRRNYLQDDETFSARQHFVHYGYVPGFGFYHYGLIHLVGAFASSGTSLLRQLVDSGTLANIPGGFKSRGMRVKGEDSPIRPGEWRDVDVPAGTIKDNILTLPYKEPSQTLMTLMSTIVEEGRRFANTADLQISDMSAQAPVGTTLAILERTLKTMSAVQARVHYSMRQELGILKEIIASYTPTEYEYEPEAGDRRAKREDYEDIAVIPVSDPNASTMAQRIVQYQAVLQLAQGAPHLYNLPLLHRQMLEVLGIDEASKLVPLEEDQKATDPVTENQNVLMGKPVKAFPYQDHEAHIQVHMAGMKDPKVLRLMEDNPNAEAAHAAMMAHINEHIGFQYRAQIELELGFSLPPTMDEAGEEIPLDPEVEARLSPLLAQAAKRLLAKSEADVAHEQAQEQSQDPLVQMQQAELQIKQAEVQRKAAKDALDAQARERQQALDAAKILARNELEREKLRSQQNFDAKKAAAHMREDRDKQVIQAGVDALSQLSRQTHEKNRG